LSDKYGLSFLHDAFWFLKNETLVDFLEEFGLLKSLLGQDFFNELILMRSYYGVFLSFTRAPIIFPTTILFNF
jgi:hypothetical protein